MDFQAYIKLTQGTINLLCTQGGSSASKGTTIRKVVTKSTAKSKEEKRTKKVFSLPGQRFEAPEEVCPITHPMMKHVMSGPMNLGILMSVLSETSCRGLAHCCLDQYRHGRLDKEETLIGSSWRILHVFINLGFCTPKLLLDLSDNGTEFYVLLIEP